MQFGADDLIHAARSAKELGYDGAFILAATAFPKVLERDTLDKLDLLEADIYRLT